MLEGFYNANYVGDKIEGKSTSEACQFLGSSPISWASKKYNSKALSTIEVEYFSVVGCCSQLL
uniref:Retrovirus-related Pol polyprotein from transposon TNT 1-94 n=1 Tax=Cajanus cajan TaxID=3821 RepID=A0A151RFC6_CAJCA|nr:hypothetical protein KK1_037378 [Cajanus cajan]